MKLVFIMLNVVNCAVMSCVIIITILFLLVSVSFVVIIIYCFSLCLVCIVPELHLGFHFNKTHFHQCTDTTCSNLLFNVCTDASGCGSNQKRNVL